MLMLGEDIKIKEVDLFQALKRWAKGKSLELEVEPNGCNMRRVTAVFV